MKQGVLDWGTDFLPSRHETAVTTALYQGLETQKGTNSAARQHIKFISGSLINSIVMQGQICLSIGNSTVVRLKNFKPVCFVCLSVTADTLAILNGIWLKTKTK